ncbi:hypothetical protein BV25DRAFT_975541 [Artomyces pyxidatus]|uniref:Uncharacterized protein n=1 Tax=Artomyces pyxidatus TaxID=48021 RepID=A0ACB8SVT8_9AGAM|nr:hypothetical protein BV25DRAFT_975541 [Artomyces pyxidatus]
MTEALFRKPEDLSSYNHLIPFQSCLRLKILETEGRQLEEPADFFNRDRVYQRNILPWPSMYMISISGRCGLTTVDVGSVSLKYVKWEPLWPSDLPATVNADLYDGRSVLRCDAVFGFANHSNPSDALARRRGGLHEGELGRDESESPDCRSVLRPDGAAHSHDGLLAWIHWHLCVRASRSELRLLIPRILRPIDRRSCLKSRILSRLASSLCTWLQSHINARSHFKFIRESESPTPRLYELGQFLSLLRNFYSSVICQARVGAAIRGPPPFRSTIESRLLQRRGRDLTRSSTASTCKGEFSVIQRAAFVSCPYSRPFAPIHMPVVLT